MTDISYGWFWVGFSIFVVFALSIDTFFIGRKRASPHESMRAALSWTFIWVSCALIFNGVLWCYVYHYYDTALANKKALEFFAGYLLEESLSIDNLFAFYLVFQQLRIPRQYQHRVFSIGIWSAIIFRLIFILLGVWLISKFHWLLYVMGFFLFLTGVKMFFSGEKEKDLADMWVIKITKRLFRVTHEIHGQHLFIRKKGLLYATPLFVALVFIELTDIIFAFDSIPAIFAVTRDPFIVWTSNIFAILGLRTLYFVLSGMAERLRFLKYGIALILIFIGLKMLIVPWIHIPVGVSLGVIAGILLSFTLISLK
jgi:tellurite resistance protein TerC